MRANTHNKNSSAGRKPAGKAHQQACGQAGNRKRTLRAARPLAKVAVAPPEPVLYKLCKPGWAVIVETDCECAGARGLFARFCPKSPPAFQGPVRGFQKDAAGTVEPLAASGGIGNRWHAH